MIKLPRTLHIEGSRCLPGKTDPEAVEYNKLDGQFLVIEEKVDGSGVAISLDNHLNVQVWHRGSLATGKEFKKLNDWANQHWDDLLDLLGERYIIFGEWMYNKHTIFYDNLPHYFLESDIYDKVRGIWLSTNARNDLLSSHRYIKQVQVLATLKPSNLQHITCLVGKSFYQSKQWVDNLAYKAKLAGSKLDRVLKETDSSGMMEGLYIKHEDDLQVVNRYKYVRHQFLATIINSGTHLIDRIPIYNSLKEDHLIP